MSEFSKFKRIRENTRNSAVRTVPDDEEELSEFQKMKQYKEGHTVDWQERADKMKAWDAIEDYKRAADGALGLAMTRLNRTSTGLPSSYESKIDGMMADRLARAESATLADKAARAQELAEAGKDSRSAMDIAIERLRGGIKDTGDKLSAAQRAVQKEQCKYETPYDYVYEMTGRDKELEDRIEETRQKAYGGNDFSGGSFEREDDYIKSILFNDAANYTGGLDGDSRIRRNRGISAGDY